MPNTRGKVSKYGVSSGSYFPVFSPNKGKYGPEKSPYLDTFHAVKKSWAENSRLRALGHPFIVNLLFKVWWLNYLPLLLILPKSKGLVMPHQLILSQFSFFIPPENVRKPTVTEVFKEYRNRALASRKSVWFCPENICFFNVFRGHRNGTFA